MASLNLFRACSFSAPPHRVKKNLNQPKGGEFFLFVFFQGTVKIVDVNSVLRFCDGYETFLTFDNQKPVFLFKDIWSL